MRRFLLILLLELGVVVQAWAAASPKRIYIALDDHTDYMWAADEASYQQAFLNMLDYYLNQADATQGELPEYQNRFTCDGTFWLWTYEHNRPASQMTRLAERIRDGHITVPYNTMTSLYGGQPAEAVLRGMYYAGALERRYNLKFKLALTIENVTLPYGLPSLYAGAGARYAWNGIAGVATKIPSSGNREHPIYWWTGPDGSRLLMKWFSFLQGTHMGIGGYAEAYNTGPVIEYVDGNSQFKTGYPYDVIGVFGYGGDAVQSLIATFGNTAKNKTNTSRQVIVSNEQDFFEDFEAVYGASLPAEARSYGNEWDLYSASMAEVSARVRRAVEKLRGAEALATLVCQRQPDFMAARKAARDQAWIDLGLYWNHDWTVDGSVSRSTWAAWERRLTGEIEDYANTLQADAERALGRLIYRGYTPNPRFYVFNPLSWTRTDRADILWPLMGDIHVVDLSTNQEVPSQWVTLEGQRYLRVLAPDIPPVGYKVFEIVPDPPASLPDAATVSGGVIENSIYRLTVSPGGSITSLAETRTGREFARTVGGRAINDLGGATGSLQVENAGSVSVTLVATASAPLQHTSRITLTRDSDRIEIHNTIDQNFNGVYSWGFGFALDRPDVWHEEVGALAHARLTSDGGHYAANNARYDWLTLNHFADMSDPGAGVGVTLSNADCAFMRLGLSTVSTLDTTTSLLSPLAGGQIDGSKYGIPSQGGDSRFLQRFALRTHEAFDPAAAMRFALEHQNPLIAAPVSGGEGYPEQSFSLLTLSNPNVLLWSIKPAEDGLSVDTGFVARLWNLSGGPTSCSLATLARPVESAWRLTHVETPLSESPVVQGTLATSMTTQQLQTFAINEGLLPPLLPAALSITCADANPSSASEVRFLVRFNQPVRGVDASDFVTSVSGLMPAAITRVQSQDGLCTVTIATGPNVEGGLRLDLTDDDSIIGALGMPLGGPGTGNGNHPGDEVYAVDPVPPSYTLAADPPLAGAGAVVTFTSVFSEALATTPALTVNGRSAPLMEYRPPACTFQYTLSPADPDGAARIELSARDRAGNPGIQGQATGLWIDQTAPGGTILVDGGAAWTTSNLVQLTLAASDGGGSGVEAMRLSNDGVEWSPWEAFAASRSLLLDGGEGLKTVYVQFRDRAANLSVPASASIMLVTVLAILSEPADLTVNPGTAVSLSVVASGTAPLAYQWQKDGQEIAGAAQSGYLIPAARMADAGWYACTVRNLAGSVQTRAARLVVNPTLTVISAYGAPSPAAGTYVLTTGTQVSLSLLGSPIVDTTGTTRRITTGWSAVGSAPASGITTQTTFLLTQDTTLTWHWIKQYRLTITIAPPSLGQVTLESTPTTTLQSLGKPRP